MKYWGIFDAKNKIVTSRDRWVYIATDKVSAENSCDPQRETVHEVKITKVAKKKGKK